MSRKYVILATVAAAAVLTAVAAISLGNSAGAPPNLAAEYVYANGRLWARVTDGERHRLGLIDTGASISVFSVNWAKGKPQLASQTMASAFGTRLAPAFKPGPMRIADHGFDFRSGLVGETSYPIIGSDFLFSFDRIRISKNGLEPNATYDMGEAIYCSPLTLNFAGNNADSPIKSVFFELIVDGVRQKAFLDTGRQGALAATALAPIGNAKHRTRLDIRFNSIREWKLAPYYSRNAALTLGTATVHLPYQHFYNDRTVTAPFVVGGGILETYQ
ncbi:MAG: hypothetical protein ACJ8ET_00705, partial [Sphingomicrobium sp.]